MKVNQIDISKDMKVSDLIAQFEASDVLGAGRVARATDILANMINCFSNDKGRLCRFDCIKWS